METEEYKLEIRLAMARAGCHACGKLKDRRRLFCWSCLRELPGWLKGLLQSQGHSQANVTRAMNRLRELGRVKS